MVGPWAAQGTLSEYIMDNEAFGLIDRLRLVSANVPVVSKVGHILT